MRNFIVAAAVFAAGAAVAAENLSNGVMLGTDPAAIRAQLTGMGWEVRKIEQEDGKIEAYVIREGERREIYVDPKTGAVIKDGDE